MAAINIILALATLRGVAGAQPNDVVGPVVEITEDYESEEAGLVNHRLKLNAAAGMGMGQTATGRHRRQTSSSGSGDGEVEVQFLTLVPECVNEVVVGEAICVDTTDAIESAPNAASLPQIIFCESICDVHVQVATGIGLRNRRQSTFAYTTTLGFEDGTTTSELNDVVAAVPDTIVVGGDSFSTSGAAVVARTWDPSDRMDGGGKSGKSGKSGYNGMGSGSKGMGMGMGMGMGTKGSLVGDAARAMGSTVGIAMLSAGVMLVATIGLAIRKRKGFSLINPVVDEETPLMAQQTPIMA